MLTNAYFAKRRPDWAGPNELPPGLELTCTRQHNSSETLNPRTVCPGCQKSRSWYCAECPAALCDMPTVKLPLSVRIVTHPQEKRTKCTGVQAVLLAPDDVEVLAYTDVANEESLRQGTAAVLFPSEDASTPDKVDLTEIDTVYVVDSAWKKARGILQRPEYKQMKHIKLSGNIKSSFWRFHTRGVSQDSVCTIEALFFFLCELQGNDTMSKEFQGPHYFDNLLWYFALQHQTIHRSFQERKRRRTGGIKTLDVDSADAQQADHLDS